MTEEPWNKHTPGDPMPCKCGESVVEVRLSDGTTNTDRAKYWDWDKRKYTPGSEITGWRFVERKGEDVIHRCAMQYYYKDNACPAEHSRTETCICWHDEGKGPFPDLKNGDAIPMAYGSAIGLTWRTAPQPAPTYEELLDKIDGLESDLDNAVETAINRGAVEWGKLNYPNHPALRCNTTSADPYDALEWDEDGIATVVTEKPGRPEWVRDDDLVRFNTSQGFDIAYEWVVSWRDCIAFQIKRRPDLTPAEPQLLAVLSAATNDEADAIRSAARRANIEVKE